MRLSTRVIRKNGRRGEAAALAVVLMFLGLSSSPSCSRDAGTPEDRIRALVTEAEAAAENRDLAALKEFIDEDYSDGRGNDRSTLLGVIRYHFLRNESIHLLTRVSELRLEPPGRARLELLVAVAGEPIPSAERLEVLRADIYRLDLLLAGGDGEPWKVTSADWKKAGASDLF